MPVKTGIEEKLLKQSYNVFTETRYAAKRLLFAIVTIVTIAVRFVVPHSLETSRMNPIEQECYI